MNETPTPSIAPLALWQNRAFNLLFGAQLISLLGSGVTTVGLALFAYQFTGGASATAVIGNALMLRILAFLLFSQPAGVIADRVRKVKPEHLRGRTLLLRERGSSTRAGAESLLGERLKEFERVVEIPNAEALKQAVAAGLGIAVLSSWATRLEETAGLLRPVRDPLLRKTRSFYLVKRKDRSLSGTAAALWQHLL